MTSAYIIETWEDEPSTGPYCEHCGWELERELCEQCDGEGWLDSDRLMEEDPLWYSEGDTKLCEECRGEGGWWICENTACPEKRDK